MPWIPGKYFREFMDGIGPYIASKRRNRKMYLRWDWDVHYCRRQGAEWFGIVAVNMGLGALPVSLVGIDVGGPPRRSSGTLFSSIE